MAYKVGRCLLQSLLDEKHMSQVELANKLGVTKQQINKYAKNKQKMSIEVAINVVIILNCRIEDLYELIEVGA